MPTIRWLTRTSPPALLDLTAECVAHPAEVDDARRLDAYGRHGGDVGLVLLGLLGADHPTRDTIGLSAPIELLERWHLREFGGHDELAADVDEDPVALRRSVASTSPRPCPASP